MNNNHDLCSASPFRSLLQVACILALLGGCFAAWRVIAVVVAVAQRAVPPGQWVEVEVLASLAIDPEDRLVEQLVRGSRPEATEGEPRGSRGPAERLLGAIQAAWARLAQVRVSWQLDVAALRVLGGTRLTVALPVRVQAVGRSGRVEVLEVSRAGGVVVVVGGRRVSLNPGQGVDVALVPTADGRWIEDARQWRAVVTSRIAQGLPVGRLSVTNLGLQPQPK